MGRQTGNVDKDMALLPVHCDTIPEAVQHMQTHITGLRERRTRSGQQSAPTERRLARN